MFFEKAYVLNFNDIRGISEIMSTPMTRVATAMANGEEAKRWRAFSPKPGSRRSWMPRGTDTQNRPAAGVGRPRKESDCRVSMLNLARRKAANAGNTTGT